MNIKHHVRNRISAARAALVMDHAFFGALALRMKLVEDLTGRTRTMMTDGRSIFYNRDYVSRCSDLELVGLFAHEVMHPALLHHTRRGNRNPILWNEAGDYAINPILVDAGLTLPGEPLIDEQFHGMSAERIYEVLQQRRDDHEDQNHQEQNEGTEPRHRDLADTAGAVIDAPDAAQQEVEWQVALKQAVQAAQLMGQLPAGIVQAVEEVTKPRIDWKAILRRFVQQFASADYSWRMPNRRYIAGGLYLPEIRSESMPTLVVVVDSSGSTISILPTFKAELQSIVDECQPEATIVIMADAAVQRVDRFERGEPLEFNVQGLGGTDFRPAFWHVDREQIDPACLIYLTDGDGVYPDEPADYPTLWAISTPGGPAPWGETVPIDPIAS